MSKPRQARLLQERAIGGLGMPAESTSGPEAKRQQRPTRSVTVNLADSPRG